MDQARIVTLLRPFIGDAAQQLDLSRVSTYIDILLHWNARVNLTAIRDPEQIVTRHFGESLFAASQLFPESSIYPRSSEPMEHAEATAHGEPIEHPEPIEQPEPIQRRGRAALQGRVSDPGLIGASAPVVGPTRATRSPAEQREKLTLADLGSGAGFPGIPIKLWAPEIHLTLIESNHKKATFLREVSRALTLTDINIQNARAETLHTQFDVITLRAVERFDSILPVAASLVAPNGRLAVLIGISQVAQARALLPAFEAGDPLSIPQSESRTLLISRRKV